MTTEPDLVTVRREARARRRARARVRMGAALATGAAGVLCVVWATEGLSQPPSTDATPPQMSSPSAAGSPPAATARMPARAIPPGRASRPVRVTVPELGIDAPVAPMSAKRGVLTPPSDASRLGWWDGGARAGAASGTVVVAGHTVHDGGGAFDHLGTLEAGAQVVVRTRKGVVRYAVRRVETYDRATLAEKSSRLFRRTGSPRLLLVTCDDWDGTGYRSNTVAFATPVAPS